MKRILLLFGMMAGWLGGSAQTNIAPAATVTASSCQTAPNGCAAFNDLNFGTCGTQDVWISGTTGIFIEWNWPSVQAFDEMVIHHGGTNTRFLSGFTMERWDGSAWVNVGSVSNLAFGCSSVVAIPKTFSSRFRINNFTVSGSQTNNPNFREIEIFQASTSPDDAGISSVDQSLSSSCPGTFPVFVNVDNFGTNQINGVTIDWEVNGVLQTPTTYTPLLDTAGGANPNSALVNLGNITYAPATNYNVKAWTSMPNMGTDTVNDNDTATATLALGPPQGLGVQNVLATTADVVFGAVPGITYQAIVVPSGTPASAGTATAAQATSPINVTGLSPSTLYDVYLFGDCGTTFSDTAGPETFITPIQGPRGVNCITGAAGPIFTENFESSSPNVTGLGNGAGIFSLNTGGTTSTGTGPLGAHEGSQYIYFETSGGTNTTDSIVTNAIDLTTANDSAEMSFWLHAIGATIGTLNVGVGTSATGPFTQVFTSTGAVQAAQGDPWQNVGVRLDSYVGQTIYVKFEYTSGTSFTGDLALDLIEVTTCVTCPNPTALTNPSVTATTANMSWLGNGVQYEIEYGTVGYTPGTGTSATTTNSTYTITGLTANTGYDVFVRNDCSGAANGFSGWVGPVTINTLCTVFAAPFIENFDGAAWVASGNNAGNQIDQCWNAGPDMSQGTEPFKWVPRSTGPTSGNGPLQDATGGNFMYVEGSGSAAGDTASLETPAIDVSGLTTPALYFEQHRFGNNSALPDMEIYVSNDFGATWSQEYSVTGDVQTATGDPYELVFVNLGAYTGDTVIVRFLARRLAAGFGDPAIDKVELKEAPTCPWPTGQSLVGATDTTATITFNDPTGANWDVEWGPIGFTQGTGSVSSFTNDTISFGPLSPNTCYDVYVRTNCSANSNGVSIWRGPIQFCTQCVAFTAPYTQDFDGTSAPELDNCWTPISFNANNTNFELQTDAFRNFSPPNSMEIHNNSASAGFLGIASPRFSDLDNQKRLEFYVYDEDGQFDGSDLIIGVMTDLSDETTFTPLDTITEAEMDDDVWEFFVVDLNNNPITSGGGHVVFRHGMNSTFDNIHIDDFSYDQIPACQAPLSNTLGVTGVSTTGATALWGSGSQGVKTYFAWGLPGFTPQGVAQLGIDSVAGSVDQGSIIGLTSQTTYEFYIQDSCSSTGLSPWVGPFTFTTPCLPASMPYYESFDTWSLTCWDSAGGTTFFRPYNAASGQYARADFWSNNGGTYELTSRPIDISVDAQLRFDWSHLYSTFYPDDQLLVLVKTLSATTWDTILDLKGPNNFNDPTAGNSNTPGQFITEEITLDPAAYTGDTIQVRLFAISDWGPDLFVNDLYVEAAPNCPNLANLSATNITVNGADLTWNTSPSAVSYEVWYGPQGFFQGTLTAGGTVVTSGTNPTTVSGLVPSTCYEFLVRAICGPGDTTVWSGPVTFCTPCVPVNLPYYESYNSWPLTCWDETGGTTNWAQASIGANSYARADFWSNNGGTYVLTSPAVIVSADAQVRFDWSHLYSTAYPDDQLLVLAKTLSATTWDTIVNLKGAANFNDPSAGNSNTPGNFINEIAFLDPTTYTGDTVIVQLYAISDWGPDLFIEDFYVEAIPTCLVPNNLATSNVTASSADLSWTAATVNPGTNFQISYGLNLAAPSAGTTQIVTGTNVTVNLLAGNSNYCYFVREICAPGDSSAWAGPICFSTLTPPPGCTDPSALAHNTVRCDSVEVSWNSAAATIQSVLEYGPIGFTPGTGTLVANASSPQLLAGLTVSTDYDVYLVDICATDTSAPVGPYTINTGTVGAPVAAFNATQQGATLTNQDVDFNASTSTGSGNSYAWDFGDGNSATGAVFTHSYLSNNTFTVTLIVTNACGSDTITQVITTAGIGLEENALGRSLNVFPNPASDVVNVSFETMNSGEVQIRLVDVQGREIRVVNEKVNGSTYQKALSVKALSSGMYILEVQSGTLKARRAISVK
jgi:hypothetical protein